MEVVLVTAAVNLDLRVRISNLLDSDFSDIKRGCLGGRDYPQRAERTDFQHGQLPNDEDSMIQTTPASGLHVINDPRGKLDVYFNHFLPAELTVTFQVVQERIR